MFGAKRRQMEEQNNKKDQADEDKSFAELLDENFVDSKRLKPGEKVEARVVNITQEWVFIDMGSKSEGYLDRKEFYDGDGNITIKEGDKLEAYFLSSRNNEKLFTTKIGKGEAGRTHLEEAFRSGIPVEGFIEKEIKGGFDIKIGGNIRAFCPFSQMGTQRIDTPSEFVGQHLSFKIMEFGEKGRNIIVSNRIIEEEAQQKRIEALKESLKEGMTVQGTIASVQPYGAFVDIGGVQGLLPVSEVSWGHVEDIREIISVDQTIELIIINLDWDNNRITLSLKEALPDPWEDVDNKYPEGTLHTGIIARLTKFGAFVTLEPGIDGLIHVSKLGAGKRLNHPGEVVEKGQTIEVQIEKADKKHKRLSLTIALDSHADEERHDNYKEHIGKAKASLGTLGDLLKSKLAEKKNTRT
jgi:small subunit ribosomal protein S1